MGKSRRRARSGLKTMYVCGSIRGSTESQKFETYPDWGAILSPLFSTHFLHNTPFAGGVAGRARTSQINQLYSNLLVFVPWGTPKVPPVHSCIIRFKRRRPNRDSRSPGHRFGHAHAAPSS